MSQVHTAHGEGRILESETVRGQTRHRVAGVGFDCWLPETQVHQASAEDGWMPIPDDREQADPYADPGMTSAGPGLPPGAEEGGMPPDASTMGGDADFSNELSALADFAATGEISPQAQQDFGGSPDPAMLMASYEDDPDEHRAFWGQERPNDPPRAWDDNGYRPKDPPRGSRSSALFPLRTAGPGDNVDHDNSVKLPYNPDPQHDAVTTIPDGSWGPGEYTIDADERLHPADSLSFNDVAQDEAGPEPGPNPDLFVHAAQGGGCLDGGGHEWHWWGNNTRGEPVNKYVCANCAKERDPDKKEAASSQECDYCGKPGHSWQAHPGAHADVAAWEREKSQLEEPFGVHHESARTAGIGDWMRGLTEESEDPYEVLDSREWERQHGDFDERLVDRSEAEARMREHDFNSHGAQGLDRAAGLNAKYVDVGYGIHTADHFNDPVQRFRDDPHEAIQRRGSMFLSTVNDADEVDFQRHAALMDGDERYRLSAWRDVRKKAKRLRDAGKVQVKDLSPDRIYATVEGDTGTYETMITKGSSLGGFDAYESHGDQRVGNWHCSCNWGNWAFKRRFTFIGRLCSHGLASYWEMQAAHQARATEPGTDPRRSRVKTKRAARKPWNENPDMYDPADDPESPHYDPHGSGVGEDDPRRSYEMMGKDGPARFPKRADILRTTPRGMTPDLNFIDRPTYDTRTVDVTSLDDIDMPGADDEGTAPDEREAARILGRRVVAWIAEEVLPDFEEWYKVNHGRELDQARPTEASQAAADYAAEKGLDQSTSEMLQEFVNRNFSSADTQPGSEAEPDIKHFEMAAGRYLLHAARVRTAAPGNPFDPNDLPIGPLQRQQPQRPAAPGGAVPPSGPVNPLTAPYAGTNTALPPGIPPGLVPGAGGAGGAPAAPASGAANPYTTMYPAAPAAPAAGTPASGTGSGAAPGPLSGGGNSYTVKPGDTLSDIAKSQGVGDYQDIAKSNSSAMSSGTDLAKDPNMIHPGDVLKMPGGGGGWSGGSGSGTGGGKSEGWFGGGGSSAPASGGGGVGNSVSPTPTATPSGPGINESPTKTPTATPSGPGINESPTTPTAPTTPATPTAPTAPTTPTTGEPPAANTGSGSVSDLMLPKTSSRYVTASDDALLNHLRDLAHRPAAENLGHMQSHTHDVRSTINELRDRGYDASQLVAMVRTAADADGDGEDDEIAKKRNSPENTGMGLTNPAAPASPAAAPAGGAAPATPVSFPTPSPGKSTPQSAPSAAAPSVGAGAGAGFGSVPPRPEGISAEQAIGGTGDVPSGTGGGGANAGRSDDPAGAQSTPAGGGIGGDFMDGMKDFGSMIGPIADGIGSAIPAITQAFGGGGGLSGMASGLSDAFSGGGLSSLGDLGGMASGLTDAFSGIMGSYRYADDDKPLLGEDAIEVTKTPDSFAGSGPDHQRWMSSSEDYVDAHETQYRQDIDDFDGDILKYSGRDPYLVAMMRHGNAFDDYADWAVGETGSTDVSDWGSPSTFIDKAKEDGEDDLDYGPAEDVIDDYRQYSAAFDRLAANSGYFGVGAQPAMPTTDGLAHANGAANMKSVTKPKKVKPPKAPKAVQPQRAQMGQPQQAGPSGAPSPSAYGMGQPDPAQAAQTQQQSVFGNPMSEVMAQPRNAMFAQAGSAPQVQKPGGIQRQGAQLSSGGLAPVFADAAFSAPPPPDYPTYAAPSPTVQDYNPYRQAAVPERIHTSPWDDDPMFGHQAAVQPQPTGHRMGGVKPAALRDDFAPNPGDYQRTNDSSEVVRQFQAMMGGGDWETGYSPTGVGNFDVSAGAHQFLARTAGRVYSQAEQAMLEQESHPGGARNLDQLDLTGTHYI